MSESRAALIVPLTTCHVCGNSVPVGEFCGACGAHLVADAPRSAQRAHAFAANPSEHLLHLSPLSTLFPHLPHRRTAPLRFGLAVTAGLLLILGLLRLTGPAIAAAAIAVPLLYLLYLYEVEVYEDEPVLVIGATFGLGVLIGIPWALWTGPIITHTLVQDTTNGAALDRVLRIGVLLPLAAQVLMLAGALVLYFRRRYDEALDGLTFGAATALGFTLATTFANLWPELQLGITSNASMVSSALDLLQRGLFIPFIDASTTGLIAGTLWLQRGRVRTLAHHGWTKSLGTAIIVALAVRIGLGLVNVLVLNTTVAVAIYGVVAIALVLWVRVTLHHMLLAEAVDVTIGPELPCYHCHRIVPRMAFCPHCGVATRATPKTGTGRQARDTRTATASTAAPEAPTSGPVAVPHGYSLASHAQVVSALPHKTRHPLPWILSGSFTVVFMVVLGVVAYRLAHPPFRCSGSCLHSRPPVAARLPGQHSYTSPSFGFSLEYQDDPNLDVTQHDKSIEWDVPGTSYGYAFFGDKTNGDSAEQIVDELQQGTFPDAHLVYHIPNAEIGYVPGAGAVYDYTFSPGFGETEHDRVIIQVAEKRGIAVELVAVGPFKRTNQSDGQPNPAQTPIVDAFSDVINTVTWPGDPKAL